MTRPEGVFDFLIVGSGAGGSAAAYRLARAGRSVLLLEKGDFLPADGSTLDPQRVLRAGAFKNKEIWCDRKGRQLIPEEFFNVGGKTKWYGAALLRFAPAEFEGDATRGHLPWPFNYRELEPYYEEAERLLEVRCFEIEPGLQRIAAKLGNGAGWFVEPLPLGLVHDIYVHRLAASRFDGFALPGGLKADAEHRLLGKLAGLPNFRLITGADVARLSADAHDPARVSGVVCRNGRHFRARYVLLAAGALHSPRLLEQYFQRRRLTALPASLHVGRYYKRHLLTAVLAFSPWPQRDLLRKTAIFTHRRYPHSSVQPLGGRIDREILALQLPRFLPRWLKHFFTSRVYGFFLQTEDGSNAENRVHAANGKDAPTLDYDSARLPAARREHGALVRGFMWSLLGAGLLPFAKRIPLEGSAHSVGTLVAGTEPRNSVVNSVGLVHGMDNLFVVDGSVLPRSGRLNPALTIYAWSLRVADRLLGAQAS